MIRREFINVDGQEVHFRIAGNGPPIVLLHDSPRSSVLHLPQLEHFADEFTVIALDTPGYGNSAPLPREPRPEIGDFADSLAATLTALAIERCTLYGFHTSSKIALEFAVRHPTRVAIAIMDGLNLPPGGPGDEFIARYMKPFEVNDDGSHLATAWSRSRDLHRFFPWFDTTAKSRLPMALPNETQLHAYTLDLLMAGANYLSAYSAAMRYLALPRLAQLTANAVFMCRDNDPLYPYLDTIEQNLPTNSKVLRLGGEREPWLARLRELFRAGTLGQPDYRETSSNAVTGQCYVSLPHGQVRVCLRGPADAPALLLVHDLPGSIHSLGALAEALAAKRRVITLDLPGEGESDPLAAPDCAQFGAVIAGVLRSLGVAPADVYAQHWAAPLAVECALQSPALVRSLTLDGPLLPGKSETRQLWKRYCPSIAPRWDGSHLIALWHQLRDRELNWPWYAHDTHSIRNRSLTVSPKTLHALVTDLVKQPNHYGDACRAAIEYRLAESMSRVASPVATLLARDDVRYDKAAKLARKATAARLIEYDARTPESLAAVLAEAVAG